jgi:hypothetical protein
MNGSLFLSHLSLDPLHLTFDFDLSHAFKNLSY